MAYFRLEPFGEERADLRSARLMALLAQINSDGGREFSADDFMLNFDGDEEVADVSVADKARAIFGGAARKDGK